MGYQGSSDRILSSDKRPGNLTSGALPSSFEKRYIPANVTLNSFELDILSSSVVDPDSVDTDFEAIGGLQVVKEGC